MWKGKWRLPFLPCYFNGRFGYAVRVVNLAYWYSDQCGILEILTSSSDAVSGNNLEQIGHYFCKMEVDRATADLNEIERGVKNKFRWDWLEEKDVDGHFLSDYIRKLNVAGQCKCIVCNVIIKYGSSRRKSLVGYGSTDNHMKMRRLKETNETLPAMFQPTIWTKAMEEGELSGAYNGLLEGTSGWGNTKTNWENISNKYKPHIFWLALRRPANCPRGAMLKVKGPIVHLASSAFCRQTGFWTFGGPSGGGVGHISNLLIK